MLHPGAVEHRRGFETRLETLRVALVVCFGALAVAFWILQVIQNAKYEAWADKNYLREIPLRAPRGVLFDRTGRVLVDNRDSFTIVLLRERTANLDQAIQRLAEAIGWPEGRVREPIERARQRRDPIFRPIVIVEHASFQQVISVKARQLELPEVQVLQVPTRLYPDQSLAAHVFGYVSEIRDDQLKWNEYAGLEPGAMVGQSGVERAYNAMLMGQDGRRNVVVNSVGREIGEPLGLDEPQEGRRLQLTIDYDLQKALEDGFRAAGFNGAAAFLDPRTGEILAMTSLPAYDPNLFASGIDRSTWAALTGDPLNPLTNRLVQGKYAPGSTFKIVTAIAALGEGLVKPDFKVNCTGGGVFYGRFFQCHRVHGVVDLRHALEQSCNTYFYTLGEKLKIDTIHDYAKKLGLVGKTGIDLPGEVDSFVASEAWNQRETGQRWYPGETISVSIGQGKVSVTPIALATMISTVANGGTLVTPHLLRAVDEGQGWKPVPMPAPRAKVTLSLDDLQAVRDGLWMVVNGAGTGGRARIDGKDVAGKTGTAQVVSLTGAKIAAAKMDVRHHGFFVFFAPRDNPQIAGIVFAEHGLHGSSSAAPTAKYVMETFFAKQEGRPLPEMPATLKAIAAVPAAPEPRTPGISGSPRAPGTPEPRNRRPSTGSGRLEPVERRNPRP